jgi:hypothetical protein
MHGTFVKAFTNPWKFPNGIFVADINSVVPAIMLTLDLLLLSPPWTIKFQGALTLSTFLAFAYCKFSLQRMRHCVEKKRGGKGGGKEKKSNH